MANGTFADIKNTGTLTGSHNLIEDGSGGIGLTDTLTGDPDLGPLADNGGPTQTMALLAGSPAIDAGDNNLIPAGVATDQRRPAPHCQRHRGHRRLFEAQPLNLVVETAADENDGNPSPGDLSLREAIALTNANPAHVNTISFDPTVFDEPQTTTLTNGQLTVTNGVTITGPAASLTISGGNATRIFNISATADVGLDP